jgi:hypothetical protein
MKMRGKKDLSIMQFTMNDRTKWEPASTSPGPKVLWRPSQTRIAQRANFGAEHEKNPTAIWTFFRVLPSSLSKKKLQKGV